MTGRPRITIDPDTTVEFVRRGGVWVPKFRVRNHTWKVIAEWAGMTVLACGVVGLGGLIGLYRALPEMNRESQAFAEQSLAAIADGWSRQALFARAEPELGADSPSAYLRLMARMRAQGAPTQIGDCQGRAALAPLAAGDVVSAHYVCQVRTRKANSLVSLSLKDDADAWRIDGFFVEPARRR